MKTPDDFMVFFQHVNMKGVNANALIFVQLKPGDRVKLKT
jgi:hypothetical protein